MIFVLQQTIAAWRTVYMIAVGINLFSGIQYLLFAKGDVQWWNTYWKSDSESKEVEKA